jgi:signal transduction histidine kinase
LRIGTRITLTASILVALTLGIYGILTLRARRAALEGGLEREAREVATTLRVAVENSDRTDTDTLSMGLQRAGIPWRVEFLDARSGVPSERLRRMIALRASVTETFDEAGRRYFVMLEPVRERGTTLPDASRIIGAIQLTRETTYLDAAMTQESVSILVSMLLLIAVLVLAISISTRSGIGRPIEKLIAGIDDVTRGDLSHVLLQEREDEIGALAARFNGMTKALRDAQAETKRSVDERLTLEAHLRDTSQYATIGQLAAEIAHEVGTPLNVVTGRARAMAKKSDDPDAVQKNATIIAEQAGRITRIIQRLLDVARRKVGATEKTQIDMNRLASDSMELLEYQLASARIVPQTRLLPSLPKVTGEKDQLQQVLLNLYMNAIQAMPSGGELEVRTSRIERRRPGLEVAPEQTYAVLHVADRGVGISQSDREKIFEAFYTSKAEAGGTGLGLAVANGIVKEHDGWMEIDDNPGGGTVFRVFLPCPT